ncbi:MAG TPA: DUF401 family protein [Thermoplasmatales archaeon]|nr:DUF401 family protein [Thermoplasmatales archaeon]
MSDLLSVAALVLSFSVIIVLVANRKNFGLAMLGGAFLLGLLSAPREVPRVLWETITDWRVATLAVIVLLIKVLATVLQESGQIPLVIDHLKRVIPPRGMLATIPFIFGLLPIPGGALLSAPMVEVQGKKLQVTPEGRTFINLWFRHIGFLVFPLSTALVVMSQVSEVHINRLIALQTPIFLVTILVGLAYVIRLSSRAEREFVPPKNRSTILRETLVNITPLLATIVLTFVLSTRMELNIAFLVALPTGIGLSLLLHRGRDAGGMLKRGLSPSLAVAVLGIMLYRNMAYASGVTEAVAHYLQQASIPALLIIPLLSFAIGVLTAHNMAAIPLLYSMLAPMIDGDVALVSLLYISSFMGYLISPLHLCVVVSYDYFKPHLGALYKLMLPPAALLTILAVLLAL